MPNKIIKSTLPFLAAAFCINSCLGQTVSGRPRNNPARLTFSTVLSWLPADTETLIVANGPFLMHPSEPEPDESRSRVLSEKELDAEFEALPTDLVGLQKGLLEKTLTGKQVAFALEASRHFRPPSGLGGMLYEGCEIVVFADDLTSLGTAFMTESKNLAVRFEELEGQKVAAFQEKLEDDVWTTLVAFPKPNVLVVATNRDYLREVLVRMGGAKGPRALADDLPEWKYLNKGAHCWGLRHYDRSQAEMDPSSPIGGEKAANFPDDEAIGLAFSFGTLPGSTATVTYLSGAKDILPIVQAGLFPSQGDPESVKDLRIRYRQIAPGAIEGSFELVHSEPASFFFFVLLALLGHAVYL